MLGTNMCIYVLKQHSEPLRQKFKSAKHLSISSVTYGELCFGIENGAETLQAERWRQLGLFIRPLSILPWDDKAAKHYGNIRAILKKQGNIIGNNDLLIAAHARNMDLRLVTNNVGEFARVPGLLVENWLID
jgi:tRNA(fMet)-specific endonuclease VapC